MLTVNGIISQKINKLPENERGSVSIDRCMKIARIAAIRNAEEVTKNQLQTKNNDFATVDKD